MANILLEFGTYEDKSWLFNVVNFDLSNVTLRSQIRSDTGVLVGSFAAVVVSATQFQLSVSSITSGAITPGSYQSDVLATNTNTGFQTFITPIFDVVVIDRVTEPVTVPTP